MYYELRPTKWALCDVCHLIKSLHGNGEAVMWSSMSTLSPGIVLDILIA